MFEAGYADQRFFHRAHLRGAFSVLSIYPLLKSNFTHFQYYSFSTLLELNFKLFFNEAYFNHSEQPKHIEELSLEGI